MKSAILYLLVGIALSAVAYKLVKRKAKIPKQIKATPTSLKLAIKNLKIARGNIGKNSSFTFIGLLTYAIKCYLSAEFKYVDGAKTSDEILAKFVFDITNDWLASSLITEIFSLADQVKFAKRELTVQQQRGMYKKACRLILNVSRSKRGISPCK
ncbi:MAG: hypothetical protein LBS87_01535 [Puniceicoccales bacterium]|nr:hypothetical protein [Puniceicoccales bacterium]